MIVPEKLKLNKFKIVRIPKKQELFARFGMIETKQNFTGDKDAEREQRQSDQMNDYLEWEKQIAEEAAQKTE